MFRFLAVRARHRIAAFLLAFLPALAPAATVSDLWWNPSESGWGANIIEQEGTLFVTLFLYGTDGRPTWYVGPATVQVASGTGRNFTGPLYATTGPWFGSGSFNPNAVGVRQVGTVTFTATSPVRGTLSYTADGISVSRPVQRQTWKHIVLSGTYYGAIDGLSSSTCSTAEFGTPFDTTFNLTATVASGGLTGTLVMTITDAGSSMRFSGNYEQFGSLYEVSGTITISGTTYTASIRDFTADDDGIRGNLLVQGSAGCVLNLRFSAVLPG